MESALICFFLVYPVYCVPAIISDNYLTFWLFNCRSADVSSSLKQMGIEYNGGGERTRAFVIVDDVTQCRSNWKGPGNSSPIGLEVDRIIRSSLALFTWTTTYVVLCTPIRTNLHVRLRNGYILTILKTAQIAASSGQQQ